MSLGETSSHKSGYKIRHLVSTSPSTCTCDQQSHICTARRANCCRRSWQQPLSKAEPPHCGRSHSCMAKESSLSGCEIPPKPSNMSAHISLQESWPVRFRACTELAMLSEKLQHCKGNRFRTCCSADRQRKLRSRATATQLALRVCNVCT